MSYTYLKQNYKRFRLKSKFHVKTFKVFELNSTATHLKSTHTVIAMWVSCNFTPAIG